MPCYYGSAQFWHIAFTIVLLIVVSGWRPRWTCVPHCLSTIWFTSTIAIPDGGDHVATVVSVLLLPVCLADNRKWHWSRGAADGDFLSNLAAYWSYLAFKVQLFAIYLHAFVGKMAVAEWTDGTAVWYWSRQRVFGFANWLRPWSDPLLATSVGTALATYGALFVEGFVLLAIVKGQRMKWAALILTSSFHFVIALTLGLVSFFFAMAALLVLGLVWPQDKSPKLSPTTVHPPVEQ